MRLICGFLQLDRAPAEIARLDAMIGAMAAPERPCRQARFHRDCLAMAVLDFDRAAAGNAFSLPQAESGLILAADARIDAPEALVCGSDTDLLRFLASRQEHGLEPLSGDFALAAWDPQRQRLWLARDAMGIRPLFYAYDPGRWVAFASLPAALHASGWVERRLDRQAALGSLLFQPEDPGASIFAGLRRVPPGTWLSIGASGLQQGRHWQLDPATAGTRSISPEAAARELAELVGAAVRRRLPRSGPVAAHLSGGVDSSSLAILAARALRSRGDRLIAYSLVPAQHGSRDFGGRGAFIAPTLEQEPDIDWKPMPVVDGAVFVVPRMDCNQLFPADPRHPEIAILADAAQQGAQVLLSGWGGDEGASYTHRAVLAEALLSGHWRYFQREVAILARRHSCSKLRTALRELLPYLVPPEWVGRLMSLGGRRAPSGLAQHVHELLRPEMAAGIRLSNSGFPPDARRIRFRLLSGSGLARRAEQWALAGARYGVAPAFPLLDRALVTFALSLPSHLFVREGWTRRVFRDAMAGVLPEAIRWKPSKVDLATDALIYPVLARGELFDRLDRWRQIGRAAEWFDLDRVATRLRALPDADTMAALMSGEGSDTLAPARAHALIQAFRFMAFVEEVSCG